MIRSKPNYELKARVLRDFSDTLSLYQKASRSEYAKLMFVNYGVISYSLLHAFEHSTKEMDEHFEQLGMAWLPKEIKRINHAYYERQVRLKKRITNMLKFGSCLFITFTFTDNAFANTSKETRRIAVRRYLKSQNVRDFVANIDFGKQNHREHYHAVALVDNNLNLKAWRYGAINIEHIKIKKSCDIKLAKYVAKLTNHAIKETTKRCVYIYARVTRGILYLDRMHVVGMSDYTLLLFVGLFFAYFSIKCDIVIRN